MNRPIVAAALVSIAGFAISSNQILAQVLHDNGGLVTTPVPTCLPLGSQGSQLQVVSGVANGLIGLGCQLDGGTSNRIADDFVITDPNGWNISSILFYMYQTSWASTTSPIASINLRIWNGQPGTVGATVVWGDTSTNRLASTSFSGWYRVPSVCLTTRMVFRVSASVNTTLPPGTYWLDFQASGDVNVANGPWAPPVTLNGVRGKPGANAIQFLSGDGTWSPVLDAGPTPPVNPPIAQDFPFVIYGPCTANCDGSTVNPVLTANDFQCFLDRYAAGSSHANCDGSTVNPVLTANDFQCFLNKFAAGCS